MQTSGNLPFRRIQGRRIDMFPVSHQLFCRQQAGKGRTDLRATDLPAATDQAQGRT